MNKAALGAAEAALLIVILVALPLYAADIVRSAMPGFNISAVISYFFSAYVLALGVILAIVSGLSTALRGPRGSGAAKVAQGALGVLYFYMLLHAGDISISILLSNVTLAIGLDLTLMAFLLYIGAALRMVQGALMMFQK